ncbi:Heavy metal-associated isoprenylated plant protein 3 [Cardamine amara subsp. amara]|uniref:Heavy metal-associated isoprenylated plant protein 3 n=1 Tax=Cardamine amara subsp. amara TaxID=228776 RepID=A0ABD1AYV9_CARAN
MGEKKKNEGDNKKKGGDDGGNNKKKNETPSVTVVLKVDMHCEGCASRIVKCVRSFQGVETVKSESATGKLTVTGALDPAKLREKLEEKTKKKVDLVSPQPKKEKENNNKDNKDKNKSDENKTEEKKKNRQQREKTQRDSGNNGGIEAELPLSRLYWENPKNCHKNQRCEWDNNGQREAIGDG